METEITLTKLVAPEDIRPGDYLTLLRETHEFFNFCAVLDPLLRGQLILRAEMMPDDAGVPLHVVAVCLPFVLVEDATEKHRTLDLRRQVVARLDENYARKAMKRLRRVVTAKDT